MRSILLVFLFVGTLFGQADDKPKAGPEGSAGRPPMSEPSAEEIQAIRKLVELPPERLSRMRAAIESMERMSPEERANFSDSLAKLETASPEERIKAFREMREKGNRGLGLRVFEYHLKQLTPEEAKAERENLLKLTAEERQQYLRKLLEKYGPELLKQRPEGKGHNPDKGPNGEGKDREPKQVPPA
jgi:hypothetical protein